MNKSGVGTLPPVPPSARAIFRNAYNGYGHFDRQPVLQLQSASEALAERLFGMGLGRLDGPDSEFAPASTRSCNFPGETPIG